MAMNNELRTINKESCSIRNEQLCKTNPISKESKMSLSLYLTSDYENKSGFLTTGKQTQSNPILSASGGFKRRTFGIGGAPDYDIRGQDCGLFSRDKCARGDANNCVILPVLQSIFYNRNGQMYFSAIFGSGRRFCNRFFARSQDRLRYSYQTWCAIINGNQHLFAR